MQDLSAELDLETHSPNSLLLRIRGRLYMGTLSKLEEGFEFLLSRCAHQTVVVDLSETTYVSSNCWSVFLINARRIQSRGGVLLLAGMRDEVLNAYELLELRLLIRNFPNVSKALSLASLPLAEKTRIKA